MFGMADSCGSPRVCRAGLRLWVVAWSILSGCEARTPGTDRPPLTAAERQLRAAARDLPRQPAAAVADAQPRPAALNPELIAGTFFLQDDVLRGLEHARVFDLRPVGSTSTVFRASIDATFRAAFKVPSQGRPNAALNEVAAYRLARCLGLSNVPPAIIHRLHKSEVQQRLDPAFAHLWSAYDAQMIADRAGYVEGALIYWIEDLRELGLESPRSVAELVEWLQIDSDLPPERELLAMQFGTLLAFDYLIGNWDRWSGANLMGDSSGQIVYVRDNDSAFAARIHESILRRILEPVLQTQRYSRSFVLALRALTRESFARELARDAALSGRIESSPERPELVVAVGMTPDPPATARPVLDARAFDAMFDRRDTLLTHLAALIDEHGEAKVVSFP